MAQIELDTSQLQALLAAMRDSPQIAQRVLRGTVRDILTMLAGAAGVYPEPPANSTYNRTGVLGKLWTSSRVEITVGTDVLEGRVGNNTPYGPYVQSSEDQAEVHRGRWQTIEQIIAEHLDKINSLVGLAGEAIAGEIMKRIGR